MQWVVCLIWVCGFVHCTIHKIEIWIQPHCLKLSFFLILCHEIAKQCKTMLNNVKPRWMHLEPTYFEFCWCCIYIKHVGKKHLSWNATQEQCYIFLSMVQLEQISMDGLQNIGWRPTSWQGVTLSLNHSPVSEYCHILCELYPLKADVKSPQNLPQIFVKLRLFTQNFSHPRFQT